MIRIAHIEITCLYIEGMGYQENILPHIHQQMGYEVSIITTRSCDSEQYKGLVGDRSVGTYYNTDGVKVIILPDNPVKNKYRRSFSPRAKRVD